MSITSYRHNEALGVTGPMSPTALPASAEQLYRRYELDDESYRDWLRSGRGIDFFNIWQANARQRDRIEQVIDDLGGFSCRDLELEAIDDESPVLAEQALGWFLSEEWRVIVKLRVNKKDPGHIVGIRPLRKMGQMVRAVSNFVPNHFSGPIRLDHVARHLAKPKSQVLTRGNRFLDWNILALPKNKKQP